MRRPLLVALWIVATAATTAVAYVAVNAAGAEVTDRPLTSVVATGATAISTVASATAFPGTSTTGLPATTSPASSGASSTTSSTVSTTATSGFTTSTTVSSPMSGTTAAPAPWQQSTIPSRGGLVIVSHRPGEVRLESVAPTPGFGYEIDESGPPDVRVEFEGGEVRVEVRVRWDGGLVIEVDEN